MTSTVVSRRAMIAFACSAIVAGCTRVERCATCGMRVDPKSPWRADLVTNHGLIHFDTPRCALMSWRGGTAATSLLISDFYDQRWQDAGTLRFVAGSDVIGPMGTELVPVDGPRISKFMADHHGVRSMTLEEITPDVLARL